MLALVDWLRQGDALGWRGSDAQGRMRETYCRRDTWQGNADGPQHEDRHFRQARGVVSGACETKPLLVQSGDKSTVGLRLVSSLGI